MGINHRRSHIGVSQHCLDRTNIIICLQKMRGEAVPKSMRFNALGELCYVLLLFSTPPEPAIRADDIVVALLFLVSESAPFVEKTIAR